MARNSTTSTPATKIKTTIKNILKRRGINYAELAKGIGVSLPTVRRYLTQEDISVETLVEICEWLGVEFFELVKAAEQVEATATNLSESQEAFFAESPHYYTYLRLLASGHSPEAISDQHHLSKKSTQRYLAKLESLGLISQTGKAGLRLLVPWPARWRFPGALQKKYARQMYHKTVDHMEDESVRSVGGSYGTDNFFMLDSLNIRKATYQSYVRDVVALYQKYNAIGRIEARAHEPDTLITCAALFGVSEFAALTETMGQVKEL